MKNQFNLVQVAVAIGLILVFSGCNSVKESKKVNTLKDAFAGKFYIGAALNKTQILGTDTSSVSLIKKQFNAIVPENCMKSEEIQPVEGEFDFSLADKFVEFGEKNNLFITGHCLIWHSQAPKWFFVDAEGKDVSREVMIERMRTHISTVVGRYKGKIKGWDVVNECINDDGSWRNSKFYQIIGEDFVPLAFQFAHEADPDAELYYNDYSMANEGRRNGVINMVKSLQEKGIRIDGIGMQAHIGLDEPSFEEFEKSLLAFSALGVNVMITELDLSVLPMPHMQTGADVSMNFEAKNELNPYTESLPDSVENAQYERYLAFFKLMNKHQDKITRVTTWGVHDGQSWKNNWPVRGRTDYPLLFDRNYRAKRIVETLIQGEL